ncbi:MAG TPA: AI-2E family transporter, partial [Deltaproteobacteria bacterium]|nr:AI-2E family transporter [Deltaproteobacteria bacterium]
MPTFTDERFRPDTLLAVACLVVIIAGMKAASGIIVPLLLAVFISMMCKTPFAWLKKKGVPALPAIVIIMTVITSALFALGSYLGISINDFLQELPVYQSRFQDLLDGITSRLARYGLNVPHRVVDYFDPSSIVQIFANIIGGLGNMVTWSVLILFMVVFILMESHTFVG